MGLDDLPNGLTASAYRQNGNGPWLVVVAEPGALQRFRVRMRGRDEKESFDAVLKRALIVANAYLEQPDYG
jgi:hypothetical protein